MELMTFNEKEAESEQVISEMTIRYLTSSEVAFPTKSILEEEKKIKTWLAIGACGGITYGRARIGKTVCLKYVANSLREQFGDKDIVIVWNITDHPDTERNFYCSLLMAMGYECPKQGHTALLLKERILNDLIIRAHKSPYRKVIIFVDEAWKLKEKDFYWLMDLYNNLSLKDIQLSIFMFGTKELKDLKHAFKLQGKHQIIGRFMINEIQYYGIKEVKELQFCMASFDKMHVRTINYASLNCTLKDFYFPYAKECSFFELGEEFWKAFQQVREKYSVTAEDIPMKYFMDAFVICLCVYGRFGSESVVFPTKKELVNCIELSGYGESADEYN